MKPFARRLTFILLILLTLGALAYLYVAKFFLPHKMKDIVIRQIETFTRRPVSIGSINYVPIKGFVITDFTVFRHDEPTLSFLEMKEASFSLIFPALLWERNIVITNINLESPYLYAAKDAQGHWSFADILKKDTTKPRQKTDNIFIKKITLKNGHVDLFDASLEKPLSETFHGIDVTLNLALNKRVNFTLKSSALKNNASIDLEGFYDIDDRAVHANVKLKKIDAASLIPVFYKNNRLKLYSGFLDSADLSLTYKDRIPSLSGKMDIADLNARLNDIYHVQGDLSIKELELVPATDALSLKGQLTSKSLALTLPGEKSVNSSLQAAITQLTITPETLDLSGTFTAEKTAANFSSRSSLESTVLSGQVRLKKQNGVFDIRPDITIAGMRLKLNDEINAEGNLKADNAKISASDGFELLTSFNLEDGLVILKEYTLKSDVASDSLRINYSPEGHLSIKTTAKLNNSEARHGGMQLTGNSTLVLDYTDNLTDPAPGDYHGTVTVAGFSASGLPQVDRISSVTGTVSFKTDEVSTQSLSLTTMDTVLNVSGALKNFSDPYVRMQITAADVPLDKAGEFFPDKLKKDDLQLSGSVSLAAAYQGRLDTIRPQNMKLAAELKQVGFKAPKFNEPFYGMSGSVKLSEDALRLSEVKGRWRNHTFNLAGTVKNFTRPDFDLKLTSEKIELDALGSLRGNALNIGRLKGYFYDSSFSVQGSVSSINSGAPFFNLKGNGTLNLKDLEHTSGNVRNRIYAFKPIGVINFSGQFRGASNQWRDWTATFNAESSRVMINNYDLYNVNLAYAQADRTVTKANLAGTLYDGTLSLQSSADLAAQNPAARTIISLVNMDLKLLRKQQNLRNKYLSGKLNVNTELKIPIENPKGMLGNGSLTINDGFIWQKNLLEGLTSALLIPEYQNLTFTSAKADFSVKNQRIYSDNAHLTGNNIDLKGRGYIGFDKTLNFDITPYFSQAVLQKSESLRKGPSSLITQIINVKLTGTLDKPIFRKETSIPKVLERSGGIIKDSIGTIFEGVLDAIE